MLILSANLAKSASRQYVIYYVIPDIVNARISGWSWF